MTRFSKLATYFTRGFCTPTSGHAIQSQSSNPLISLLVHRSTLQRRQVTWFQRSWEQEAILRKQSEEENATLMKQCRELKTELLKLTEEKAVLLEQYQEKVRLLKECRKHFDLTSSKPYVLDCRWLDHWNCRNKCAEERIDQDIKQNPDPPGAALMEKRARKKLETILQVRGFLRFVVDRAISNKIIEVSPEADIQHALDKLAQTPEFTTIFQQEVKARGLEKDWVMECVHGLDHMLSLPTLWSGNPLTIKDTDFDASDRAALITLLKVQSNWEYPLAWSEEISCKAGK